MRRTYSVLFSGFVAEEARGPLLVSESHTESAVLHAAGHPFSHRQIDRLGLLDGLACISHHLTAEARDTTAMTSLRWLAVLDVPSSTPARAKRLAPRPDGPLTHFASPRGEKCRLRTGEDRPVTVDRPCVGAIA